MTGSSPWTLIEQEFDPKNQHHKETVFTIGNGYLSTRGSFEEGYPHDRHATLIHGVFDDVPVVFTELANAPDWTALEIRVAGERFTLASGDILDYERSLDLRNGLLKRQVRWRSPSGRTLELCFERFTSLENTHILVQQLAITPIDFDAEIQITSGINGAEDTLGLLHWEWVDQAVQERSAYMLTRTRASGIDLALAFHLSVEGQAISYSSWDVHNHPTLVASWEGRSGKTMVARKYVSVFTSRDTNEPFQAAQQDLALAIQTGWKALLEASSTAWQKEWNVCDVVIEGDDTAQIAVRFSIFQLLIAGPRYDEKVNIGAKTLSGFGYRGHAFWDTEIFMLPFFIYCRPEIARNLLSYRWHTLPGARKKARDNGFEGAQFAWESANTGEEVTPTWVPHPTDRSQLIRIWTGDIEIHVSADIAYAIDQYWRVTGDDGFMFQRGAEVILETARFWASRAEWNAAQERYEFRNVIGPDENHDRIDNNAYTNYLAHWHLLKAIEIADGLAALLDGHEVLERLEISSDELARWRYVAERIFLTSDPVSLLVEQFDGYFGLQDIDLAGLEPRSISVQELLGIDGACATQVLKQPDVLMLAYLLPALFDDRSLGVNYDYYTPRTDHTYGSSLGPSIQAIMASRMGRLDEAYEHFMRAARADLYNVRGNAGDGIHGASAGGIWQAAVFGFGGLQINQDGWSVTPQLPAGWQRLAFTFTWRGEVQRIDITE